MNKLPAYSTLMYAGRSVSCNGKTQIIKMGDKTYVCEFDGEEWKVVREYSDTFPIDAKELE